MPPESKFKMTIAYDGTRYGGWQVQPNATTIQELIQKSLETIFRKQTFATGSGRTDAGVHALGQTAHFHAPAECDLLRVRRSLNALLPHDIRILDIEPVDESFHARYSAQRKIYRYNLTLGPIENPFTRLYSWHIPTPFDIGAAGYALSAFVGTHDFASFANTGSHEGREKDTVRTIYRAEILPTADGIAIEFEGNGFLYQMVRNMVGSVWEAATGKLQKTIAQILEQKDRRAAGQAAPPHGLFLVNVIYNEIDTSPDYT